MLSKKLLDGLNGQINGELASAYLYLSMSAWFETENLPGSAAWMRKQAKEEVGHAMKLFDFINDCDSRVTLAAVAQPPAAFKDAEDVWKQALANEQKVTAGIHKLYEAAEQAKEYAAQAMLQWFVTEQVEEEKTARSILEQVEMVTPHSPALFFVDRHLGKDAAE